MTDKVEEIANSFLELADRIRNVWTANYKIGSPFIESIGWDAPALAPLDAISMATDIANRINEISVDGGEDAKSLIDYLGEFSSQADRITFANFNSNPVAVISSTFNFLMYVKSQLPPGSVSVDWERVKDSQLVPKRLASKLRALEARIESLEPRSSTLANKISIIEAAHDAAEALPTDLEELRSAAKEIEIAKSKAIKDEIFISELKKAAGDDAAAVASSKDEAEALVRACEVAYRITTSAGLAGAFEYRSRSLARTGWVWVSILTASLLAAVAIGKERYDGIKDLLIGDHASSIIIFNIVFAILGICAPVWLAWLATKNVGQSFRLSEDYAFKASVSKAYEGYRKEAVSLDPEFVKKLFGSALSRIDEAPSRFIVREEYSSPLDELSKNPMLRDFLKAFPEIREKLSSFVGSRDVASAGLGAVAAQKANSTTLSATEKAADT